MLQHPFGAPASSSASATSSGAACSLLTAPAVGAPLLVAVCEVADAPPACTSAPPSFTSGFIAASILTSFISNLPLRQERSLKAPTFGSCAERIEVIDDR